MFLRVQSDRNAVNVHTVSSNNRHIAVE